MPQLDTEVVARISLLERRIENWTALDPQQFRGHILEAQAELDVARRVLEGKQMSLWGDEDEEKHPREKDGKWAHKGEGGGHAEHAEKKPDAPAPAKDLEKQDTKPDNEPKADSKVESKQEDSHGSADERGTGKLPDGPGTGGTGEQSLPGHGDAGSGGDRRPATAGGRRSRVITAREEFTHPSDTKLVPERLRQHLTEQQQHGAATAIKALSDHGGFLLADSTGTGKTRQILTSAAHFAAQGKKVIIVAPSEVIKPDWKKGAMAGSYANDSKAMGVDVKLVKGDQPLPKGQIQVTTYNKLNSLKQHVDGDTVVLWDECFPYDAPVITNRGVLPIGKIVEQKLDVLVLSCNLSTGEYEWKPVVKWIKNRHVSGLVRVTHEHGSFLCTPHHKVWTEENGYTRALSLLDGDQVRVLRSHCRGEVSRDSHCEVLLTELFSNGEQQLFAGNLCIKRADEETKGSNDLPVVWSGVFDDATFLKEAEVLRMLMCGVMEDVCGDGQSRAEDAGGERSGMSRHEKSCDIRTDEEKQSHEKPGNCSENGCKEKGTNVLVQGREWAVDGSTEDVIAGNGSADGIRNQREGDAWQVSESSNELQGGPGRSGEDAGNRSGWGVAQASQVEVFRQAENGDIERSRVVGVEVYQREGDAGPGQCGSGDQFVYNLEVADNHNYFAHGVLVSNSHALKNYTSARAKHGAEINRTAHAVMFATATPVDKPIQLTYLQRAGIFGRGKWADTFERMGLKQREIHTRNGTVKEWVVDPHVGSAEVYRRMSGLFDRLTDEGLMIRREIALDDTKVKFTNLKMPQEAHDTMARIAQAFSGEDVSDRKSEIREQLYALKDSIYHNSHALKDATEGGAGYVNADIKKISNHLKKQYEQRSNLESELEALNSASANKNPGLMKALMRMHQRRQQEPFKVDAVVDRAKQAIKDGRQVVIFCSRINESEVTTKDEDGVEMVIAKSEGTAKLLREALEQAGIKDITELHGNAKEDAPEAMENFQSGKAKVVIATIESGGPQPYSAKVLTPSGWVPMGELEVGDSVIAGDGTPTVILDIFEQGVQPVFQVTTASGARTRCTVDHLWRVSRNCGGKDMTKPLSEIMSSDYGKYRFPVNGDVQFEPQDVGIDPYLMGLLLGNGSFCKTSPTLCSPSIHVIESACAVANEMGLSLKYKKEGAIYTGHFSAPFAEIGARKITGKGWVIQKVAADEWKHVGLPEPGDIPCGGRNALTEALRELGLWGVHGDAKFIPEDYLINTSEVRLEVLRGLMDTDGSVEKDGGNSTFCSKSKQLADGVAFLVRSLGGTASIALKPQDNCYYVKTNLFVCPFRMPEKVARWNLSKHVRVKNNIKDIQPAGDERCRCLLLDHPSHLYVTDDFIVTHNTGINLDDTKGDAPRTMLMMTAPFSAVQNLQAIGRIIRLNTKSTSEVEYFFGDTDVDQWNASLISKKMKTVGAAVEGDVMDLDIPDDIASDAVEVKAGELIKQKGRFEWPALFKRQSSPVTKKSDEPKPELKQDLHISNDVLRRADFMADSTLTPKSQRDEMKRLIREALKGSQGAIINLHDRFSQTGDSPGVPVSTLHDTYASYLKDDQDGKPKKPGHELTRDEIISAHMDQKGSADWQARKVADLADKLTENWKPSKEFLPKDRPDSARFVANDLKFLREIGYGQVAWDRDGNVYHARSDAKLPEWLSSSGDDKALEKLPARDGGKPEVKAVVDEPVKEPQTDAPKVDTRQVNTKNGTRHVHSFLPNNDFWTAYRRWKDGGGKPEYLSVGKDPRTGDWQVAVWGKTASEVYQNVADLKSRYKKGRSAESLAIHTLRRRIEAWETLDAVRFARFIAEAQAELSKWQAVFEEFREGDHPRGDAGKFIGGGTGHGHAQKVTAKAAEHSSKSDDTTGHARVTDSVGFKQWFGDSKVVDAEGKPLVVYHGTDKAFDSFKPSERGESGPGIYLTTSAESTGRWASKGYKESESAPGANIVPVYVKMSNPYKGEWNVYDSLARKLGVKPGMEREKLKQMGHDGIIRMSPTDGKISEIIAFEPTQIKSATGNKGTFDMTSAKITESAYHAATLERRIWDWSRLGDSQYQEPVLEAKAELVGVLAELQDLSVEAVRRGVVLESRIGNWVSLGVERYRDAITESANELESLNIVLEAWEEEKHPRGEGGRFSHANVSGVKHEVRKGRDGKWEHRKPGESGWSKASDDAHKQIQSQADEHFENAVHDAAVGLQKGVNIWNTAKKHGIDPASNKDHEGYVRAVQKRAAEIKEAAAKEQNKPEPDKKPESTEPLHKFPGEEGTEAVVHKHNDGYSVTVRDTDAGEGVGAFKIFKDEKAAVDYAKGIANGTGKVSDDEGKPKKLNLADTANAISKLRDEHARILYAKSGTLSDEDQRKADEVSKQIDELRANVDFGADEQPKVGTPGWWNKLNNEEKLGVMKRAGKWFEGLGDKERRTLVNSIGASVSGLNKRAGFDGTKMHHYGDTAYNRLVNEFARREADGRIEPADAANGTGKASDGGAGKANEVDKDSIFAQGTKRSAFGTPGISMKALKGDNPIWHHQGDPDQTRFNAVQKDASEWDKKTAAEIDAAREAGYSRVNYRAGSYGTLYVMEKDGKVLTKAGAEELVKKSTERKGKGLSDMTREELRAEHEKASAKRDWDRTKEIENHRRSQPELPGSKERHAEYQGLVDQMDKLEGGWGSLNYDEWRGYGMDEDDAHAKTVADLKKKVEKAHTYRDEQKKRSDADKGLGKYALYKGMMYVKKDGSRHNEWQPAPGHSGYPISDDKMIDHALKGDAKGLTIDEAKAHVEKMMDDVRAKATAAEQARIDAIRKKAKEEQEAKQKKDEEKKPPEQPKDEPKSKTSPDEVTGPKPPAKPKQLGLFDDPPSSKEKLEAKPAIKPGDAAKAAESVRKDAKDGKPVDSSKVAVLAQDALAKKPESPRDDARQSTLADLADDDEYAFARKSSIPNAGRDIVDSARHKRNAWRGLEEAEKDGTAVELVTRNKLLKNEPHNLMDHVEKNPLTALAMHITMRSFPDKPAETKYVKEDKAETAKKDRRQYLDAYQRIKAKAEELAATEDDHKTAVRRMDDFVVKLIGEYRGEKSGDYIGQVAAPDRYNGTANALVDLHRKLKGRTKDWKPMKTGIQRQVDEFHNHAIAAYPDITDPDEIHSKMAEHAEEVLDGTSVNATFGLEGEKRSRGFKPADAYVKHAERKGGPDVASRSAKTNLGKMTDGMQFYGVQWGNSVTDEEREHHSQKVVEAFVDLADVVGLPAEAMSGKGKLGIAIGARGHGTALAHYEPDLKVINLTRKSGVGSLAHEWGHFFDNMLSEGHGYMSEKHRGGPAEKDIHRAYAKWNEASRGFRRRLSEVVDGLGMSSKKSAYWTSTREVFARCFERHVQMKMEGEGRSNTYLSGVDRHPLWPTDDEVKAMAPHFDAIFTAHRKESHGTDDAKSFEEQNRKVREQIMQDFAGYLRKRVVVE